MKSIIFLLVFLKCLSSFGQDNAWKTWDERYKPVNYIDLIESEKHYADSVESNPNIVQYFSRIDNYKLVARYLGKSRSIDKEVIFSMQRVYKLFIGDSQKLNKLVTSEFLFDIKGIKVWMPIQQVLEGDFKKEIKKDQDVVLYCLFMNEHGEGKVLFNTLFISEFYKYDL